MQLKGSQRGGSLQLAKHLFNGEENEKITIHRISGFVDQSVTGALNEIYGISKGTKATKFMYSLSLNPPANENVPAEVFEDAVHKIAKKLSLENQPHVIVFHEKKGRRHAHCVWSRIDAEKMAAIQISHDYSKLKAVSKSLYLENGWKMPEGMRDYKLKSPLNFTHAEMQQALRTGRKASHIKQTLQECWAVSDDKKSFKHALKESGYWLVKGDKKNVVMVVDVYGELHPLRRKLGIKQTKITQRIGDVKKLPSIKKTTREISILLTRTFKSNLKELKGVHRDELRDLVKQKKAMNKEHNAQREEQKQWHEKRWQKEEKQRQSRTRKGVKGTWDKLSKRYQKIQKVNEQEAYKCYQRDQAQRDQLIYDQLQERQIFQEKIITIENMQQQDIDQHIQGFLDMKPEIHQTTVGMDSPGRNLDMDIEPDIEM